MLFTVLSCNLQRLIFTQAKSYLLRFDLCWLLHSTFHCFQRQYLLPTKPGFHLGKKKNKQTKKHQKNHSLEWVSGENLYTTQTFSFIAICQHHRCPQSQEMWYPNFLFFLMIPHWGFFLFLFVWCFYLFVCLVF